MRMGGGVTQPLMPWHGRKLAGNWGRLPNSIQGRGEGPAGQRRSLLNTSLVDWCSIASYALHTGAGSTSRLALAPCLPCSLDQLRLACPSYASLFEPSQVVSLTIHICPGHLCCNTQFSLLILTPCHYPSPPAFQSRIVTSICLPSQIPAAQWPRHHLHPLISYLRPAFARVLLVMQLQAASHERLILYTHIYMHIFLYTHIYASFSLSPLHHFFFALGSLLHIIATSYNYLDPATPPDPSCTEASSPPSSPAPARVTPC